MKRLLLAFILAASLLAPAVLGAAFPQLCVRSEGGITIDLKEARLAMDGSFSLASAWDAFEAEAVVDIAESGPKALTLTTAASIGRLNVETQTVQVVQSASFVSRMVAARTSVEALEISATGVQEPGAFGLGVELAPMDSATLLRRLSLGLNLDPYAAIQTNSCRLQFTYAEAEFAFSCSPCADPFTGTVLYDANGFAELHMTANHVGSIPLNVSLGASILLEPEETPVKFHPSLSIDNPPCLDLYAGLRWDRATHTLEGLRLYGIGARCEIGEIRFRGLWAFSPDEIALVKAPYWALLGFIWEAPCGEARVEEGSVAFFFGDETLFDLGEIVAEVEIPVSERSTIFLNAELTTDGDFALAFGWDFSF